METKKIFLASSEELKDDRVAFEVMIGRLNKEWRQRDITFELVIWEDFKDAMSRDGLQKEYNRAIQGCDVFVMLFFTKVGRFTLEEFETAFAELKAGAGPEIFTFFRNDLVLTGDLDESIKSLLEFKARLRALEHFPTLYRNAEDLQWQFSRQLEKLYGGDGTASGEITDSTPESRIGETALLLSHRQLFGGQSEANLDRLRTALVRAGRHVRDAVFHMASNVRRENWVDDKLRMARTIPIFKALIEAEPKWHALYGQLGFALKDQLTPDWAGALTALTRAVELRGDHLEDGTRFYNWSRAECMIHLDPAFEKGDPADATTRSAVHDALRKARREVDWDEAIASPLSDDLRRWLKLNPITGGTRK